jgi:hypothetical protein
MGRNIIKRSCNLDYIPEFYTKKYITTSSRGSWLADCSNSAVTLTPGALVPEYYQGGIPPERRIVLAWRV